MLYAHCADVKVARESVRLYFACFAAFCVVMMERWCASSAELHILMLGYDRYCLSGVSMQV